METAIYNINIANKMGHETINLALSEAKEKLMSLFKEGKKWIFINDEIFVPAARFSGTTEDNALVISEGNRLEALLVGKTTVDISVPGGYVTPSINVTGEVKGGLDL